MWGPTDSEVCGDCGTILGDRIVDTRSECECFLHHNEAHADSKGRVR